MAVWVHLTQPLSLRILPQPQSSFCLQDFHSQLELSPSPRTTLILTEISLVTSGSLVLVAQLYQTLCDPVDCSRPGSSVPGILQARLLEWVAISLSKGSSRPRDWTQVSCIAGGFFTNWAIREAPIWTTALSNSMKLWAIRVGPPKTDESLWRILTKHGPLEKGMANHFSIVALRTPWTV